MTNPTRRPFLDPDHPMFRRAWVRWATVGVAAAAGLAELLLEGGNPGFALMFLAAGVYAAKVLLIDPRSGKGKGD